MSNHKNQKSYCSEFKKSRRLITFPVFSNATDEKNQTIKVIGAFLNDYLPNLISNITTCNVVDLGFGNGDLPYKVANYMNATCNQKVIYEGIEDLKDFVMETNSRLSTLSYVDGKLIQGDCFGDDIDKLVNNPVLLIASQVIFYLDDVNDFIQRLVQKTGLVAIIIAQADGSYLNKIGQAYGNLKKKTGTEIPVEDALATYTSFHHIKILYSSMIFFSANLTYDKLLELASKRFEDLEQNSQDFKIRSLLEFIAGGKLEYLNCTGKLEHFIADIIFSLKNNKDNIKYWNYMTITVPKPNMSPEGMQVVWNKVQKLKLSGDVIAFEDAIKEGNYEIAYTLFKQGIVTCELRNYSYNSLTEVSNIIQSYVRYELRLSSGWPDLFKFLGYDLDERIKFRDYISPEVLYMQSIKYKYSVIYGISNETDKINSIVKSEGLLSRKWLSNKVEWMSGFASSIVFYPAFFELGCAFPLALILMNSDRVTQQELGLGLIFMYNSFWKKFFYTSNSAIHYIKGDDFLLQLYLFEENNYDSLRFQNSEGQTALHKAILTNDSIKVNNLLSCSKSTVDSIIHIKDVRGRLPLHDAVEYGNLKTSIILVEKGSDINAHVITSPFGLMFDLLFLSGKVIYLHGYFTSCIRGAGLREFSDSFKSIKLLGLGALYSITNYFDMKFPDSIYYFAFLHRLNPYENLKNLYNIQTIYDGYSYNTILHLGAEKSHTELTKYLVTLKNIDLNARNAKGETILHIVAAKHNLELLDLLLEKKVNINQQTNSWSFSQVGMSLIEISLLYSSSTNIVKSFSEVIFIKVVHDEIFNVASYMHSATALHYTVLNELQDISANTVIKLLENGANPDLKMSYDSKFGTQIIPYLIAKGVALLAPMLFKIEMTAIYKVPIFLLSQGILLYNTQEFKPIALLKDQESYSYKYLKQYTTCNVNNDHIIHMNEYGTYQGQEGKDIFYIHHDFQGKSEGYALIIKNYNVVEDQIICDHCNHSSNNQLKYIFDQLNNQPATILYFENELPDICVILFGIYIAHLKDIDFVFT